VPDIWFAPAGWFKLPPQLSRPLPATWPILYSSNTLQSATVRLQSTNDVPFLVQMSGAQRGARSSGGAESRPHGRPMALARVSALKQQVESGLSELPPPSLHSENELFNIVQALREAVQEAPIR